METKILTIIGGDIMEITITMKIEDEELKDLLGLQKEKPATKVKVSRKAYSQYARIFDERSPGWTKDPEMNKVFLLRQQEYANEKLKQQGYLFLNEVYDMLGFPRTRVGQVKGWVYDEAYLMGDHHVDFGLFNRDNQHFINGRENSVLLDFNVYGYILDLLEEES